MTKIKLHIESYSLESLEILEAGLLSAFQEVKDNCPKYCIECQNQRLCNELYIALAKIDVMQGRNKGEI